MNSMSNVRGRKVLNETPHVLKGSGLTTADGMGREKEWGGRVINSHKKWLLVTMKAELYFMKDYYFKKNFNFTEQCKKQIIGVLCSSLETSG